MDTLTIKQALKQLKGMRKEAKTLSALARKLKVSKQYLSDIFVGKREPGPSVIEGMGLYEIPPPGRTFVRREKGKIPKYKWTLEELMEDVKYENEPESSLAKE